MNAEQVKALLHSHAAGNDAAFRTVALQIAAGEARAGRGRVAAELRDLLDGPAAVPMATPAGELTDLLVASYPKTRLSEMVLPAALSDRLRNVVAETVRRDELRAHGLRPARKLLLAGPPGCGKTMASEALAGELALPHFVVRPDGVFSKFLGETAARLTRVFRAAAETPGVYLFDEFDGLGADRTAGDDVGEVRRSVGALLQLLERDVSDSLFVCATNLPDLLDFALFRRFDEALTFPLPDAGQIPALVKNRLTLLDTRRLSWPKVTAAAAGLSHADVVRACEVAAKAAVLAGRKSVSTARLVAALRDRERTVPEPR
ncbi:AAA family ATPase [Alienimonas sp. DA493]|uniref:AAA family ATPase n=1 Tax=Alienimonas sp. DA493 TaxID=3373605 RepID=UPI003754BBE3